MSMQLRPLHFTIVNFRSAVIAGQERECCYTVFRDSGTATRFFPIAGPRAGKGKRGQVHFVQPFRQNGPVPFSAAQPIGRI
jgi:hypothetical protein